MAGLYIHIPFCKRKCIYCDFYSVAMAGQADAYIDALAAELKLRRNEIDLNTLTTLYIGGGTPSLLSPQQIARLSAGVRTIVDISNLSETTIEVNPDDVTPSYIGALRDMGINRVSMGVQSFVDSELRAINRRHTASQAIEAVATIKSAGIANISIDLIYGLPGQTLKSWQQSLRTALSLDVSHISAYNLSYEEGTRLTAMRDSGVISECSDDLCISMYQELCRQLGNNGFVHYEISNFAKPGLHSRHNANYWNSTPYLGLGAAAHSYDGNTRRYNPANVRRYIDTIAQGHTAYTTEDEQWWQRYNELVITRLRTICGLSLTTLEADFGHKTATRFARIAKKYAEAGLLTADGDNYAITEKGMMMSDAIIRDLFLTGDEL